MSDLVTQHFDSEFAENRLTQRVNNYRNHNVANATNYDAAANSNWQRNHENTIALQHRWSENKNKRTASGKSKGTKSAPADSKDSADLPSINDDTMTAKKRRTAEDVSSSQPFTHQMHPAGSFPPSLQNGSAGGVSRPPFPSSGYPTSAQHQHAHQQFQQQQHPTPQHQQQQAPQFHQQFGGAPPFQQASYPQAMPTKQYGEFNGRPYPGHQYGAPQYGAQPQRYPAGYQHSASSSASTNSTPPTAPPQHIHQNGTGTGTGSSGATFNQQQSQFTNPQPSQFSNQHHQQFNHQQFGNQQHPPFNNQQHPQFGNHQQQQHQQQQPFSGSPQQQFTAQQTFTTGDSSTPRPSSASSNGNSSAASGSGNASQYSQLSVNIIQQISSSENPAQIKINVSSTVQQTTDLGSKGPGSSSEQPTQSSNSCSSAPTTATSTTASSATRSSAPATDTSSHAASFAPSSSTTVSDTASSMPLSTSPTASSAIISMKNEPLDSVDPTSAAGSNEPFAALQDDELQKILEEFNPDELPSDYMNDFDVNLPCTKRDDDLDIKPDLRAIEAPTSSCPSSLPITSSSSEIPTASVVVSSAVTTSSSGSTSMATTMTTAMTSHASSRVTSAVSPVTSSASSMIGDTGPAAETLKQMAAQHQHDPPVVTLPSTPAPIYPDSFRPSFNPPYCASSYPTPAAAPPFYGTHSAPAGGKTSVKAATLYGANQPGGVPTSSSVSTNPSSLQQLQNQVQTHFNPASPPAMTSGMTQQTSLTQTQQMHVGGSGIRMSQTQSMTQQHLYSQQQQQQYHYAGAERHIAHHHHAQQQQYMNARRQPYPMPTEANPLQTMQSMVQNQPAPGRAMMHPGMMSAHRAAASAPPQMMNHDMYGRMRGKASQFTMMPMARPMHQHSPRMMQPPQQYMTYGGAGTAARGPAGQQRLMHGAGGMMQVQSPMTVPMRAHPMNPQLLPQQQQPAGHPGSFAPQPVSEGGGGASSSDFSFDMLFDASATQQGPSAADIFDSGDSGDLLDSLLGK